MGPSLGRPSRGLLHTRSPPPCTHGVCTHGHVHMCECTPGAGPECAAPWVPVAYPLPPRGVGAASLSPLAAAVHTGRPQSLPHSGKPTLAAGWRREQGSVGGRRRSEADGGMCTERSLRAGWGSARRRITTHPALPSGCCGPGDKPHLGPSSQGRQVSSREAWSWCCLPICGLCRPPSSLCAQWPL